jgi:hypothetical protein
MDENLINIEFNGRTVSCKVLMPSQFTALEMVRNTKDNARRSHILFRVLESRVSEDEWENIELDMALGIPMTAFLDLAKNLIDESVKALEAAPENDMNADAAEIAKAEALLAKHRANG